jgi:hypothetical protein
VFDSCIEDDPARVLRLSGFTLVRPYSFPRGCG